jgi:hypothetical protein
VLALCAGQLTNLTNSQQLDPAGNFLLKWEVIEGTGDIVLEIQAKAAGWVSLEIVTDDGKYADVIFGGYNDEFSFGYLEVDNLFLFNILKKVSNFHFNGINLNTTLLCFRQDWSLEWTAGAHLLPIPDASKDIVLQTASFSAATTTLRVKRSLNTGDYYDVPFHVNLNYSVNICTI